MLKPEFTGQFKKDYKLAVKRGCKPEELQEVITLLVNEQIPGPCSGKFPEL
jgi:mRNA interferase YafQ